MSKVKPLMAGMATEWLLSSTPGMEEETYMAMQAIASGEHTVIETAELEWLRLAADEIEGRQEPVAWMASCGSFSEAFSELGSAHHFVNSPDGRIVAHKSGCAWFIKPLYTSAPRVPKWQPIETAPKDGRVLLGTWKTSWTDASSVHIETIQFSCGTWVYAYDGDCGSVEPTHWMPLPEPPKEV